jgi:hypothetical protein
MVWYNRGKFVILDASAAGVGEAPLALLLDVVKVALIEAGYTFNNDHEQFDEITNEGTATNYTTQGNALATKATTQDNTGDRAEFDADDTVFSSLGNGGNMTFTQIVILREQDAGATAANSELMAHSAVGSTTSNGGDVTMVWNAEGILQITA